MEDYSLTVKILFKQHKLSIQDFNNQCDLLTIDQVSLKFPKVTQEQVKVINNILLYIISVIHKVPIPQYQRIIQKSISPFYIKNKMKIKIYQYSRYCSFLLEINIYEIVHIVHYLIYGCFASASYVNMIVKSERNKQKLKQQKISNKLQGQIFIQDLDGNQKTQQEQKQKQQDEQYNHKIIHNPYEIKLPNVDGRQTSPMMNILRKKSNELGSTVRISKKIRQKDNTKLIHSLFSHSVKDKISSITIQKRTFQNKRVNLQSLLQLKQKLKTDNVFLQELRVSLGTADRNFRQFKARQTYQPIFQRIDLSHLKNKNNETLKQSIVSPFNIQIITQKKPQPPAVLVSKEDQIQNNFNYQYMSSTQKTPFRSKLNFYKKQYKQFLHTRSKQFTTYN